MCRLKCHINKSDNIFAPHIRWYGRYIDDLLLMWGGTETQAKQFAESLNNNDMNLKFTFVFSTNKVDFLDVTLTGDPTAGIVICPYRKVTATNSILMASSCHPSHVTRNLPVGELIRGKRNSSTSVIYENTKKDTCKRLHKRSYPDWMLGRACKIVDAIPREKLLLQKAPQKKQCTKDNPDVKNKSIAFSTTFSNEYKQIVKIVKKHLPLLNSDPDLNKILTPGVRFVSKRAPTIGNLVSPSFFSSCVTKSQSNWLHLKGCFKCGHSRCITCHHIDVADHFTSTSNARHFSICLPGHMYFLQTSICWLHRKSSQSAHKETHLRCA